MLLDAAGVDASTGSACSAGVTAASHVLTALGVPDAIGVLLRATTRANDLPSVAEVLTFTLAAQALSSAAERLGPPDAEPRAAEAWAAVRVALRDRLRVAVSLGFGPRFLHSTGQLHKGGPRTIVCVQVVAPDLQEIAIPGQPFGFGHLKWAQAAGDLRAGVLDGGHEPSPASTAARVTSRTASTPRACRR